MGLKQEILKRCLERVADNHDSMDTGLSRKVYQAKVGANEELADVIEFVKEYRDPDDDDAELEDL